MVKSLRVAFRVDASIEIGIGHAMRCLTLADELQANGVTSSFIMRDPVVGMLEKIKSHGHKVDILTGLKHEYIAAAGDPAYAGWLGVPWSQDVQDTAAVLSQQKPDWLIVDHYGIDSRWHNKARSLAQRIMVIDDLADRSLDCDILLDQTYGRDRMDYKFLIPASCTMLVGSRFAVLRPQFQALRQEAIRRRSSGDGIRNILVSMGGTDSDNMTEVVLDELVSVSWRNRPDLEIILGANAPHQERIRKKLEEYPLNARLSISVEDVAERMANSDLAIGTGGATSWERCSLGLPAIIIVVAENQRTVAGLLNRAGAASTIEGMENLTTGKICEAVEKLLAEPDTLKEMSTAGFRIVDGFGAGRVVSEIYDFADKMQKVSFRPVALDDARLIYEWQCDPKTRKYSHNPAIPSYTEHLRWLTKKIQDVGSLTEVILFNREPSGVIRLDPIPDRNASSLSFLVSIYIAPGMHGIGLGKKVLSKVCMLMIHADLYAEIYPENVASCALFAGCGFRSIGDNTYYRAGKARKYDVGNTAV